MRYPVLPATLTKALWQKQTKSRAILSFLSLSSLRDWKTFQSCFSITYTVEAWPFLSSKDFFPLTTTSYSLDLSYRTYIEYKTCVSWNTWFLTGALFHTYPKGGCRKLGYERPWEDNLWASTLSLMRRTKHKERTEQMKKKFLDTTCECSQDMLINVAWS